MIKSVRKTHALKGDLKGHWAVRVDGNRRLSFTVDGEDAILVNYLDYHEEKVIARMHHPPHPAVEPFRRAA